MIISCPACKTRYLVPDNAIGVTGRQVRCASCRHSWFQDSPELELATVGASTAFADTTPAGEVGERPAAMFAGNTPIPQPPIAPIAEGWPSVGGDNGAKQASEADEIDPFAHEPPFRPRRNRLRMFTWAAGVCAALLVIATGALLIFGSGDLLARFGAGAPEVPLTIQVTRKPERRTMASGNELLAVTGRIANPTQQAQKVPDIRAELRDAQGRTVYGWTITKPVNQLPPGGVADFDSAAVDVPRGSRALNLSFANRGE